MKPNVINPSVVIKILEIPSQTKVMLIQVYFYEYFYTRQIIPQNGVGEIMYVLKFNKINIRLC